MREEPPDRRARVRGLLDVLAEPVVERQRARIPKLHDRDRRERLRDRPDAVLRVGRHGRSGGDVGQADSLLPQDLAAPRDRRAHTGNAFFALEPPDPRREILC